MVKICMTFFTLQESKCFLIAIEESRRNIKTKTHSQSFNEARVKEYSRVEVKKKGSKARFQEMKRFPSNGDVRQEIVQYGESDDHGVSGSPSRF
ncbi:hypothetical protein MTR_0054s0210 [Medicago truncatula]|uniref:Uncharacterized protein n=1 Tax=Medicago truncatula TaxID=3880 RepID=A0A072TJH1_MEDTR|nr:hypothetical protein MTR_0054s0210 [Medicago truncatula]